MCRTMFFEIPYTNKLWICFVDFHFCIFSCKRSIEKEYSYIIWKCFFFMGGTEWQDYFNKRAWSHHFEVYIHPVGTTTYLLWHIYTSHGIQRVKNEHLQELMLGKIILSPNKKIITNTIRQNEIIDEELLRKANKFFTPNEFNHALEDLVNRKHALYMHINIIILPPSGII